MKIIGHALILALAVPALALATGCSSDSGGGGTGGSAGSGAGAGGSGGGDSGGAVTGSFTLIDDFERGMGKGVGADVVSSLNAPFNGGWFTYSELNDQKTGGKDPQLEMAESDEHPSLDPMNPKSKKALHVTGGIYAQYSGFGTEINANPTTQKKLPFDASQYTGIAFYGKSTAEVPTLTVQASTPASYPTPGDLEKPICNPDGLPTDSPDTRCNDDFQSGGGGDSPIVLTANWTLFKVPFSDFRQQTWGNQAADHKFETNKIYAFKFVNSKGAKVDVWVDDVAFYK